MMNRTTHDHGALAAPSLYALAASFVFGFAVAVIVIC